jgi:hypothetical protein
MACSFSLSAVSKQGSAFLVSARYTEGLVLDLKLQLIGGMQSYPCSEEGALTLKHDLLCLMASYMSYDQRLEIGHASLSYHYDFKEGSSSPIDQLYTGMQKKSWDDVQKVLAIVNVSIQRMGLTGVERPSSLLCLHVFESLLDKYVRNRPLGRSRSPETTYGEVSPSLVEKLVLNSRVSLTKGSRFLDLGCGTGAIGIQLTLETGCEADGVELVPERAQIAQGLAEGYQQYCDLWGLPYAAVNIMQDNFAVPTMETLCRKADLILATNVRYSPEANQFLENVANKWMKTGAALVVFEKIMNKDPSNGSRLTMETFSYHSSEVSWGGGTYFIYHRIQ